MTKRVQVMVRINTRIRRDQHNYIKKYAVKENLTEGEFFRRIVDHYIEDIKRIR